jgi:hypothetical protein
MNALYFRAVIERSFEEIRMKSIKIPRFKSKKKITHSRVLPPWGSVERISAQGAKQVKTRPPYKSECSF